MIAYFICVLLPAAVLAVLVTVTLWAHAAVTVVLNDMEGEEKHDYH